MRPHRSSRVDGNHGLILDALRKAGIAARSTAMVGDGFPDAVCSLRSYTCLLEIKSPGAGLRTGQMEFIDSWPGDVFVVETPEAAIMAVVEGARKVFA